MIPALISALMQEEQTGCVTIAIVPTVEKPERAALAIAFTSACVVIERLWFRLRSLRSSSLKPLGGPLNPHRKVSSLATRTQPTFVVEIFDRSAQVRAIFKYRLMWVSFMVIPKRFEFRYLQKVRVPLRQDRVLFALAFTSFDIAG